MPGVEAWGKNEKTGPVTVVVERELGITDRHVGHSSNGIELVTELI